MLYRLAKAMIERGQIDGMRDKLDALMLLGRITVEQYNELVAMLPKDEDEQDAEQNTQDAEQGAQDAESEG